jgi:translation initiation factor 1A
MQKEIIMKKKSNKLLEDGQIRRARLPTKDELFAVVREMSGGSRMIAMCEDDTMRMVRIGGKFKRRMWCRVGDLILVKPWNIQSESKADLVYRYLPAERNWIIKRKIIPEELNIW